MRICKVYLCAFAWGLCNASQGGLRSRKVPLEVITCVAPQCNSLAVHGGGEPVFRRAASAGSEPLMAAGAGAAAMDEQPADAVDGLMHILIADDDPVSRVYLRAAVERLGHRCTVAYDGAVAWELLLEERPDLLITDWQMPGLNGTELVRRVREQHDSAYVYALVLTGAADENAARETMNAGADDLIYKPLYASELERKLIAGRRALELHRRLHQDARVDVLTGIWNRRRLDEDLATMHARAEHYGQRYSIAVLDLDHFRSYNEAIGHPAGDELLCTVAEALQSSMPSGSSLYRYAGERFAALLGEQTTETAQRAAERLRAVIVDLAVPHPEGENISISIGVAALAGHEMAAAELLARADQALGRAKAKGRNRVEVAHAGQGSRPDGARLHRPHRSPVEAE
jgi:two-component system cell cycle response regulator